ncbi:30S ribosome-binding factor RbfA [Candidatus Annandia pinicola]|uniref:30S ribosome-binding factor RbfA n=1 Tax=Candidatus Annandia pinicola TaxID=1345117 RepID=UPI001D027055|nr:30S ribosome-binding factor RbfA [Candidatus Annandia pinicola]UDG80288.1 30S ribosome-binding factor [Candidatus Annandia pinicola]
MTNLFRLEKIEKLIKKEVSIIINYEINNPKIKNRIIIVSQVNVSLNFNHAKIFVITLNDKYYKNIINELQKANLYIRHVLKKKIKLRKIPKLSFVYDNSSKNGNKILKLLKKINNKI